MYLVRERLVAALSSFFGALALLLAAIGLYGVLFYVPNIRLHAPAPRTVTPCIMSGVRSPMSRRRFLSRGFSLIELLIVIAIILIIAAIAMPKLTKARMFAYEMAGIRTLHTINTAQTQYYSTYGRYAINLLELGPPPGGAGAPATASASDLITGDLALGTKSGYNFAMVGSPQGYGVNANPTVYNTTGTRSFFTDQSTVIREHLGNEPASATDPEIK